MRISPELLPFIVCPVSHGPLVYFPRGERDDDESHGFLLSPEAGLRFRIEEGVPVLLADEGQAVTAAELSSLIDRATALGLTAVDA